MTEMILAARRRRTYEDEAWRRWRLHALACISEGLCPYRHGILHATAGGRSFRMDGDEPLNGGWCGSCSSWWRIGGDRETVIASYPVPPGMAGAVAL